MRETWNDFFKRKLFSTLLAEDVKFTTPDELSNYIERRIDRKKVLIVLDDVNDSNQIEKLLGTLSWFASGSRIIVTTRDKQVLVANNVDDIYQVEALSFHEAFELFSLITFYQRHDEMEYYELTKRVVSYAKGIPLVIKVFGHLLHGKDKEVWESHLDKLQKMPMKKVYDVMRLSYDDLDRIEQKIFLDIACFFNGLNLKLGYMKNLLKDCESDNSVVVGLESLKDKALITISEDNVVSMHDIIQEMGREVARDQSSGKVGRLWDPDDVYEVLKNDKGTEAVRSIKIHLSELKHLKLSPHIFTKMSKLRFLDFQTELKPLYYWDLPQELQSMPGELRFLRWVRYPLKSLPQDFSAVKLLVLDLPHNNLEKLWDGVKNLPNLKEVILDHSRFLLELPNFSKAPNLELLECRFCSQLSSVHPSIFTRDKLKKLDLSYCDSLTKLPSNTHLSSINYLNIEGCKSLREFSMIFENLTELKVGNTQITAWPSHMEYITGLLHLNLSLQTISFPSIVEQLKENRKRVEFWNCLILDESSLKAIGLNAQINIMKFAHQHLPTLENDYVENCYGCYEYHRYQAMYVYTGSNVPEWLEYRTTENYIIVDLSSPLSPPLGFIFGFVVGKYSSYGAALEFLIRISEEGEDDGREHWFLIRTTLFIYKIATDHAYVMYSQQCSCFLNSKTKNWTRFKIKVTARLASTSVFLESTSRGYQEYVELKGFGVSPIDTSTYHDFVELVERAQ